MLFKAEGLWDTLLRAFGSHGPGSLAPGVLQKKKKAIVSNMTGPYCGSWSCHPAQGHLSGEADGLYAFGYGCAMTSTGLRLVSEVLPYRRSFL